MARRPFLGDLSTTEFSELLDLCRFGERMLRRVYGDRGVHVGANVGRAAGAGVPGRPHFHIVNWLEKDLWDRWAGAEDPPETLEETSRRLRQAFAEDQGAPLGRHRKTESCWTDV